MFFAISIIDSQLRSHDSFQSFVKYLFVSNYKSLWLHFEKITFEGNLEVPVNLRWEFPVWPTDGREPWIPALQCCPLDLPCTPPCRHVHHQGHITLSDRGSALDPWLWIVWAIQHRNLYLQNQTKLYNQPLSTTSKHMSILLLFWWKCGFQEILWNDLNLWIARFYFYRFVCT